jgi:hypothetical protein
MSDAGPGHDAVGSLCTLTVIAPVSPGEELPLKRELAAFGEGGHSPLADVTGTHLARFIVIDKLPYIALKRNHLLFGVVFDDPWDEYLPALHAAFGDRVERIWGRCDGYPHGADAPTFAAWMLEHRIPARAVVAAYPNARLADVQRALRLRRRIGLFAAKNQQRTPAAVLAAFEHEFGPL